MFHLKQKSALMQYAETFSFGKMEFETRISRIGYYPTAGIASSFLGHKNDIDDIPQDVLPQQKQNKCEMEVGAFHYN